MLCCCERDEQTSSRIMSDYNIDLGEWGVSSVPALMAKIVGFLSLCTAKSHCIEIQRQKLLLTLKISTNKYFVKCYQH